ncbi:DUF2157 domain-containing protein [Bowmanella sp. Y26]|uniref:DUF2157 domain-containing protein n=1 Tax=Bowmanella yangjiangensis TaxID=2811230 RepID=UPI001BDC325D|nr:DUF2157 domain-containing protein [Bowmanella yangjiangensis]MBT1063166.1 DUF2157 domain-containing protein [Bowmanella yangjiangensis]
MKNAYIRWLREQTLQWHTSGIISEQQQQAILALYPEPPNSNWGQWLINAFAGVILGLGVILFFAYNWQDMHRYLKLLVIAAACIGVATLTWTLQRKNPPPPLANGMGLLWSMLFGAAIWLVSQIYHIDEHYPNFFMLWGLSALALAIILNNWMHSLLALILLSVWAGAEVWEFNATLHPAQAALLGLYVFCWRFQPAWLLLLSAYVSLLMLLSGLYNASGEYPELMVLAACSLVISLGYARGTSTSQYQLRLGLLYPAYTVVLLWLLAFGFDAKQLGWSPGETPAHWLGLLTIAAIVLAFVTLFMLRNQKDNSTLEKSWHLVLLAISNALALSLAYFPEWLSGQILDLLFSLILATHSILFIRQGNRQQRGLMVGFFALLLAIVVFARFMDLFDSLLLRSLAFVAVGLGLFLVGWYYQRNKDVKA